MTPTGCAFQTSTHSYCRRRASGCKSKPWEPNSGQKVKGPQGTWLTNFSWPPSQTNVYIRNGTLTSMVSSLGFSLGVRYSKAFIYIYTQDTYSITFRNTLCGLISPPLHCPLTSEKVEIQARMQTHSHGGRLGSFPSGLGGLSELQRLARGRRDWRGEGGRPGEITVSGVSCVMCRRSCLKLISACPRSARSAMAWRPHGESPGKSPPPNV